MAEDASLEDFLDAGEDRASGDGPAEPVADEADPGPGPTDREASDRAIAGGDAGDDAALDGNEGAVPGKAADPARSTFASAPDGAACENCGTTSRRRWRDGDALVCADCKEW